MPFLRPRRPDVGQAAVPAPGDLLEVRQPDVGPAGEATAGDGGRRRGCRSLIPDRSNRVFGPGRLLYGPPTVSWSEKSSPGLAGRFSPSLIALIESSDLEGCSTALLRSRGRRSRRPV